MGALAHVQQGINQGGAHGREWQGLVGGSGSADIGTRSGALGLRPALPLGGGVDSGQGQAKFVAQGVKLYIQRPAGWP